MTDAAALLTLSNISKRFGGVKALNDVSLSIPEGAIYGLIGPNGAGKTTLFNVITGLYQADSGERRFAGEAMSLRLKASSIVQRGIARTFQNIRLFDFMTALENIMVGRHARTRAGAADQGGGAERPRSGRGGTGRRHAGPPGNGGRAGDDRRDQRQ